MALKYKPILIWYKERWGGSIHYALRTGGGVLKEQEKKYGTYNWNLTTASARAFFQDVQPHLKCKKEQVDFVLSRQYPSLTLAEKQELSDMKKREPKWRD
jgi:hypothetical protein